MIESPRISVILPAYNAAGTLAVALDSLLAQTFTDFEVVAVNDGSTDDTGPILDGYAAGDARLRVIHLSANRGVTHAAQTALAAARAPVVARMDADDRAEPQRLALQFALLAGDAKLGVVSCLVNTFGAEARAGFAVYTTWLNSLVAPTEIARDIFIESPIANPTAMFRRADALALGGYQDRGWPEDYDLYLRYHHAGWQFAKVPQVLHHWRDHDARLTVTDSRYSVENFIRAKSHYLLAGPLMACDTLLIWSAGLMGRRIAKHLVRGGAPLHAFLDIRSEKIGGTLRGKPILAADDLPALWPTLTRPKLLVAVPSRAGRTHIRAQLADWGLRETYDFWLVA